MGVFRRGREIIFCLRLIRRVWVSAQLSKIKRHFPHKDASLRIWYDATCARYPSGRRPSNVNLTMAPFLTIPGFCDFVLHTLKYRMLGLVLCKRSMRRRVNLLYKSIKDSRLKNGKTGTETHRGHLVSRHSVTFLIYQIIKSKFNIGAQSKK